jgi:hypothetical protein
MIAVDHMPERCRGFEFESTPLSFTTVDELESGMIGSWEGCVTTPWVPAYWVDITFRSDGTYSAISTEVLDGQDMNAMYYGSERDAPNKRWAVVDLTDSGTGAGQIDIVWDEHNETVRDELRNVELMADKLRFDFLHFQRYGPVTFELRRSPDT